MVQRRKLQSKLAVTMTLKRSTYSMLTMLLKWPRQVLSKGGEVRHTFQPSSTWGSQVSPGQSSLGVSMENRRGGNLLVPQDSI